MATTFFIGQVLTTAKGESLEIVSIEKRTKKDAEGGTLPNGINYIVSINGEEKKMTSDKIKSLCGIEISGIQSAKTLLEKLSDEKELPALYDKMISEINEFSIKIANRYQFGDGMEIEFKTPTFEAFVNRWHIVQAERKEKAAKEKAAKEKERKAKKAIKALENLDEATQAMMFEILKAKKEKK